MTIKATSILSILAIWAASIAAVHADLGRPELEGWITDVTVTIGEIDLTLKNLARWTRPESSSA
jgi:hypothetical protein